MPKAPADLRSLARSHTATAVNTLASIMRQKDAPHSARVSAATALLDRGWGKPDQHSTVEVTKRNADDWSTDELVAIINDARTRGNGIAAEADGDGESGSLH